MSASGGTQGNHRGAAREHGHRDHEVHRLGVLRLRSMLAEACTPSPTAGNQLLLLLGGKRAKREADAEHPFGYGRERYVYAFVVSIILFSVGGVFSLYEGIDKIDAPARARECWWLPIVVLVIAIVLEAFSLRTAIRESQPRARQAAAGCSSSATRRRRSCRSCCSRTSPRSLGLVFAFVGVGLTVAHRQPGVRRASARSCIGVLLVLVAHRARHRDEEPAGRRGRDDRRRRRAFATRSTPARRGRAAHPHEDAVPRARTSCWSPRRSHSRTTSSLRMSPTAINAVEARIREAVPIARVIYIEPDVYRAAGRAIRRPTRSSSAPSTEPVEFCHRRRPSTDQRALLEEVA